MEDVLKTWLKRLKLNESTISMFLGVLVVAVAGILVYNYFSRVEKPEEKASQETPEQYQLEVVEEEGKMVPQGLPVEHIVSPLEHLWGISEKYYGTGYNWVDIAKANNLSDPGLIYPEQKLTIPRSEVKVISKSASTLSTSLEPITSDSYTVVRGDSLWKIAVRAYQDGYAWPKIFAENKNLIKDPGLIEADWELKIPR
ncbi:MAG: hypothetical protein A2900_03915 [Candidatus Chisholmbacteria bacterium RIFCSPLOWO2_01_FULL_50_28]|uniref:LysM domain-containing protein n=1 Tax=Candidatus Chisholmbacteria bacterium RIFCSPHIGHO2_01_FULL_52_32 TaxID=1797591 RepID=A0A1G1VSN2_9BACT|nr:MAG: hypothetical protein A2786_02830 [Candidatus Chisholmbacteria bacterium RIFCSPHIGHO2_01_FULL_52_32]OGY20218.1 MAG: hypothetical protein A2900_03915 [Candidatus Chisholmbacteria bacterium RIFCSPLOWO2_01_FULL_50_28]